MREADTTSRLTGLELRRSHDFQPGVTAESQEIGNKRLGSAAIQITGLRAEISFVELPQALDILSPKSKMLNRGLRALQKIHHLVLLLQCLGNDGRGCNGSLDLYGPHSLAACG